MHYTVLYYFILYYVLYSIILYLYLYYKHCHILLKVLNLKSKMNDEELL